VKISLIGSGAANIATYRYLKVAGANPKNIVAVDSKGIIYRERDDIDSLKKENPWKYQIALETNIEGVKGGIAESLKGADVVIAASRPGTRGYQKRVG
jgi:malate dehydrogenase (oxaloacetate-decarboxylating)